MYFGSFLSRPAITRLHNAIRQAEIQRILGIAGKSCTNCHNRIQESSYLLHTYPLFSSA